MKVLACILAVAWAGGAVAVPGTEKVIADDGGRYAGWPTVTRLRNGELVVVYSGDRDSHICPYGKVKAVRSKDNGETWSRPEVLVNGILDDRDCGLLQLANGDQILFWFTSVAFKELDWYMKDAGWWNPAFGRHFDKLDKTRAREELGSFSMRSTDGGKTWEPKVRIPARTPHGGIQLKDGRLLYVGMQDHAVRGRFQDDPGERDATWNWDDLVIAESRDLGRSWQQIGRLTRDGMTEKGLCEPFPIEGKDGTIRVYVRAEHLWYIESRDGGLTWSRLKKSEVYANFNPPHLLRLKDGGVLLSYGQRIWSDADKAAGLKTGVCAVFSRDDAKLGSWDTAHAVQLLETESDDMGYASSVELDDGSFVTVYYYHPKSEGPAVIAARKWTRKEVSR